MRTYNLFRRRQEGELICAVAEDDAVPGFIDAGWEFAGTITEPAGCPLGSILRAADGSRFHGFCLFENAGVAARSGPPLAAHAMRHHRASGA